MPDEYDGSEPGMPRNFDKTIPLEEPLTAKAAAELVEVSIRTLARYENLGFVSPVREGNRRLYSAHDVTWLRCVREMIHGGKISMRALKKVLKSAPCWELRNCRRDEYADCVKSSVKRVADSGYAPRSNKPRSVAAAPAPQKLASGNRRTDEAQDRPLSGDAS